MSKSFVGKHACSLAATAAVIVLGISGNTFAQSTSGQGAIIPPPPRVQGTGNQQNGGFTPQAPAVGQQPNFAPQGNGSQRQFQQGAGPLGQRPKPFNPSQPAQTTPAGQPQQPLGTTQTDSGLPERVRLFSSTPIDQVFVNGKPADGERVSDTVVTVFIVGDETGFPCTNTFDIFFGDGRTGQLTANHCHGEVEFAVIPGQTLNREEIHDGNIDERASGIDTLSSDFQWSYFADAQKTGLQFSIPETDNGMFFAECQRGTSNVTVYTFMAPDGVQANEPLDLSVVVDGGVTENYAMAAIMFPYMELGLVPTMQIGSNHPFFADLASGQIADFYVSSKNNQSGLRFPLKGSAEAVRSFVAACNNR